VALEQEKKKDKNYDEFLGKAKAKLESSSTHRPLLNGKLRKAFRVVDGYAREPLLNLSRVRCNFFFFFFFHVEVDCDKVLGFWIFLIYSGTIVGEHVLIV